MKITLLNPHHNQGKSRRRSIYSCIPRFALFSFILATAASCDAQLSHFDTAKVTIDNTDSSPDPSPDTSSPENQDIAGTTENRPAKTDGTGSISGTQGYSNDKVAEQESSGKTPSSTTSTENGAQTDRNGAISPQAAIAKLDLGQDLVANTTVQLAYSIEANQPYELRWSKTSGPGELDFSSISATKVRILPSLDGVYTIKAEVIANHSIVVADSLNLTWDTTGPKTKDSPQIFADSLQEPGNITHDNDTRILLNWPEFTDELTAPVSYRLNVFMNGGCSGTAEEIALGTNQGLRFYEYTGSGGVTYSFFVTATDRLGNLSYSRCSNQMTVDLIPPPSLEAATATRGPRVQTVRLTLKLPADVSDYGLLEVRRGSPTITGAAIAPPNCQSGHKAYSSATFTAGSQIVIDDDIGKAGYSVSYLVCLWDLAGNKANDILIEQDSISSNPLKSKEHVIFLTNAVYKGDFGAVPGGLSGLDLADSKCQSAALAATNPPPPAQNSYLTSETKWKALLSDQDHDAKHRVIISGPVKDQADQSRIADNRSDLWDGSIATSVFFNELGMTGGMVWTGSDRYGIRTNQNCNNWSSGASGFAYQGDSYSASDFNWFSAEPPFAASLASCSDQISIYCVSQPQTFSWPATVIKSTDGIGLELSIQNPEIAFQNTQVQVWRRNGNSIPDSSCLQRTDEALLTTLSYAGSPLTWTDSNVSAGGTYTYRICLKDDLGNILASQTVSGNYQ